jgi:hypothetical protein
MAETPKAAQTPAADKAAGAAPGNPVLKTPVLSPEKSAGGSGGAYEVLRARLAEQCLLLRGKLDKLNARRKLVFGGLETALIGSSRITTENACLPRDMRALGKTLIFGYNVFFGLKKETSVSDVFSARTSWTIRSSSRISRKSFSTTRARASRRFAKPKRCCCWSSRPAKN